VGRYRSRVVALALGLLVAVGVQACGSSSKTSTPTTTGSSGSGSATTVAAGPAPTGTPLNIGTIISETAPTGVTHQGSETVNAWVKWTNAHGGIEGHPVKDYFVDDKSDPATGVAAVKNLVESDHVIAIVGSNSTTEQNWAAYVAAKKIPVINSELIDALWFTNPMFYPLGGTVTTNIWGQMKAASVAGAKNVAIVLCTEDVACAQAQVLFKQDAEAVGLKVVLNTLASSTAVSYTPQCLAAKSAGAQSVAAFVNVVVFARDCGRQGLKPIYISSGMGPTQALIESEPLLGNAVGSTPNFPCLGPSSPSVPLSVDFQQAMQQYAPELAPGGSQYSTLSDFVCSAWVGGSGFAKAITNANVPATATATNQDVIKGLSMFHGETLGGLTVPVTLSNGTTPNPQNPCIFLYKWVGTTFSAVPKMFVPTCMPAA
jgi:branched-chain amino acid transport system substrate-binding protein